MRSHLLAAVLLCSLGRCWSQTCLGPGIYGEVFNKCYYFMQTQLTYSEANYVCSSIAKSGRIACLHNAFEQSFVYTEARKHYALNDYWIGLDDIDEIEVWEWLDDEPSAYVNWNTGYPQTSTDKNCVAARINNGLWVNAKCNTKKYFVCEMNPGEVAYEVNGKVCAGRGEYSRTSEKCLYFMRSLQTYQEAELTCLSINGLLVNEDTEQKEKFASVKQMQNLRSDSWIGLSAPDGGQNWEWSNSQPYLYSHWENGFPSDKSDLDCVASLSKDARWYNTDCHSTLNSFICEADQIPSSTVVVQNVSQWIYYPRTQSLYYPLSMYPTGVFESLEDRCVQLQAHLSSIHSEAELAFVYALAYPVSHVMLLGLERTSADSVAFTWYDGTPSDFSKLESNTTNGTCATTDGIPSQWNPTLCDTYQGFAYSGVCKKPYR